jgi:hypothetical protein
MGLSLRAYAAHRKALGLSGGSDAAVRKARDAGRITVLNDGTIDPVAADAAWGGSTDTAKLRGTRPIASDKPRHQEYRIDEDDENRPVIIASPTAGMDEKSATTLNQIEVARRKLKFKRELRDEQLAEKTIMLRAPARKLVFEMGKRYATGLRSHHSKVGAKLAAKYGLNVHEFTQELRRLYDDYLADMSREKHDISPDDPEGTATQ